MPDIVPYLPRRVASLSIHAAGAAPAGLPSAPALGDAAETWRRTAHAHGRRRIEAAPGAVLGAAALKLAQMRE